jgi:hypothetical protein
MLVDLGQQLGLRAAGAGGIASGRGDGYLKPQLSCL